VQSAGYRGPSAEAYVEALHEVAVEQAMVEQIERATDDERSAMLRDYDGVSSASRQQQ
jgi:hypothetical protein